MTLEEAIKQAEEVADVCEFEASKYDMTDAYESYVACQEGECAAEHRQLVEWLKELKERREKEMGRLDNAISNVAYILDTLMAYRNVVDSGDCNRCVKKETCEYVPKAGQLIRYNCPFYE